MNNILGIDPGLSGGIALYDGSTLEVIGIPTLKASGRGREVNWAELTRQFTAYHLWGIDHAFIEQVGARPGQGVSSMFKFGYVAGGLRAMVAMTDTPVTMVTPTKWKRTMGLNASKDASLIRANELFPGHSEIFALKKNDGLAEAALIAKYGYDQLMREK